MAQYIDKAVVAAEIEKRGNICKKVALDLRTEENKDYYQGKAEAYKETLDLLDTLEVKEVDLEKELSILDNTLFDLDGVAVKGATYYLTVEDVKDLAKHFYELGLKTQKGVI